MFYHSIQKVRHIDTVAIWQYPELQKKLQNARIICTSAVYIYFYLGQRLLFCRKSKSCNSHCQFACSLTDSCHKVLQPEILNQFPANLATLSKVMCRCAQWDRVNVTRRPLCEKNGLCGKFMDHVHIFLAYK